jgi:hypothetical protein
MLRCLTLVRTDVSEELGASFIRVTIISEVGTLAVPSSPILFTLMMEAIRSIQNVDSYQSRTAEQKTALFIVTAMKTSNLT